MPNSWSYQMKLHDQRVQESPQQILHTLQVQSRFYDRTITNFNCFCYYIFSVVSTVSVDVKVWFLSVNLSGVREQQKSLASLVARLAGVL